VAQIRVSDGAARADILSTLDGWGSLPLPPYIERQAGLTHDDDERYQTVYARTPGAVAAPTAGLHFTPETLRALDERGIERRSITLHVGLGTFAPVRDDDLSRHVMHEERFEIPATTAAAHARARADKRPIVAVGTTVVRALESSMTDDGALREGPGATRLFITPGFVFRAIDRLITNFHLPKSTLLMLVSAFAGRDTILRAYREAVAEKYRFFSYGDAMLLEKAA
jgi:S-adenosylmethionine:tRNA ribosyltransferase-isomerase